MSAKTAKTTLRELVAQAKETVAAAFPGWVFVPDHLSSPERMMTYSIPTVHGGAPGITVLVHEAAGADGPRLEFMPSPRHWPRLDTGVYQKPDAKTAQSATVALDRDPAAIRADITRRVVTPYLEMYPEVAKKAAAYNAALAARVQLITNLMAAGGKQWPPATMGEWEEYERRRELYETQTFHPGVHGGGKPSYARTITVGVARSNGEEPSIRIETRDLTADHATRVLAFLTQLAAEDALDPASPAQL